MKSEDNTITAPLPPGPHAGIVDESLLTWLISLLITSVAVGAIILRFTANPSGNPMPMDRALFAAANAVTLTGFETAPTAARDFEPAAQVCLFVLTIAGALFSLIGGTSLVSSLLNLNHSRRKIILYALAITILATVFGAGFLMRTGQSLAATTFLAASAFANSGISITEPYALLDLRLHLFILPLAILGGVGLPVIIELAESFIRQRQTSPYSRSIVSSLAIVYLTSLGLLFLTLIGHANFRESIAASSTLAINSRSLGLQLDQLTLGPRAAQWVLMLLMLIGAAPAGTAGGLRITTITHIISGIRSLLRNQPPARELGFALLWLGCYLSIIFLTLMLLLTSQSDMPADRVLFLAISAVGNVGLAHDALSMTGLGLYITTLAMLTGKLAPLVFAWYLTRKPGTWQSAIV